MTDLKFLPVFALIAIILGFWALIHYTQSHGVLLLLGGIALLIAALLTVIAYFLLRRLHVR